MQLAEAKRRIFVVEDEALIALHLKGLIAELGYEFVGSEHRADQVIEALQEATPDLVLMDIRLGSQQDGIELAEEIYVCERTPVVFVSAFADAPTLDRVSRSGAFGFVAKPFTASQLNAAIILALEKHGEMEQQRQKPDPLAH